MRGLPSLRSKKKLGSYPSISVILSITMALFALGLFGTLLVYSQELERAVRENIRIQVYLKSHLDSVEKKEVYNQLLRQPFLLKGKARQSLSFVSKEEAAKKFIEDTGEDFKRFLGENPLRDAYLVAIDPSWHNPEKMNSVKAQVEKIPGVFQASYTETLIDSINKNVTKISLVLAGIALLLFTVVALLINNTLRLALFSQRFLIRSMQLVGAKNNFIQQPFLLRAALYGLIGALIASLFLLGLVMLANRKIPELALIQNNQRILVVLASLTALGIFVAVFSTWRAVNKYLGLTLDELY